MFKRYYEDELEFLRELGGEFAASYPDIAGELGIGGRDPDVERLLQGFAFLTARIRENLDSEFPNLLYPLLGQIWPHAIRPSPAIGVVEFKPVPGMFHEPYVLKRGATLCSVPVDGTVCQFRTAYELNILPIAMDEVRVEATSSARNQLIMRLVPMPNALLRQIDGQPLRFHLHGSPRQAFGLYLWLQQNLLRIRVRAYGPDHELKLERELPLSKLSTLGWTSQDALIPYPSYSFDGFRHLHEYFLFPAKHLFFELTGIDFLADHPTLEELELSFELTPLPGEPLNLSKENIRLHCVPVVNLFPHPAQTLRLEATRTEYLLRPESPRPEHFDIFSVEKVAGFNRRRGKTVQYHPFYSFYRPAADVGERPILYQTSLRPAVGRGRNVEQEGQSSYLPIDVYISFVEPSGDPALPPSTLSIDLMVTNRDLPRRLRPGDVSVPTTEIPSLVTFSNIGAFSVPAPAPVGRDGLWRYFAHMTLSWNYLADREALTSLLSLYNFPAFYDQRARQSLELLLGAMVSVESKPEHRLIGRPPALVRGTHVVLQVHEGRFTQPGELYLFGTVLSHFLGEVTTLNTFSRLSILGVDHGLEWRWDPRIGQQALV